MRALLILLLSALPLLAPPVVPIRLLWDAETNGQVMAECGYKIYASTNLSLPLTNWSVLTNVSALSVQGTNGTNFGVSIQAVQAQCFYYVTETNFWGESGPSNLTQTPELPSVPKLKISK